MPLLLSTTESKSGVYSRQYLCYAWCTIIEGISMFCWKKEDEHIWLSGKVLSEEEEILSSKGIYNPEQKAEQKWGG